MIEMPLLIWLEMNSLNTGFVFRFSRLIPDIPYYFCARVRFLLVVICAIISI